MAPQGGVAGSEDGDAPRAARVHATVWGRNLAQAQAGAADAISHRWAGADGFDVRSLSIVDPSRRCPFDVRHHTVRASGHGPGWVWILHDPALPPPLAEVEFDQDPGCACVEGGDL